jgi:cytochrome c-type biogenesis protein CcmH/NrfF
VARYGEWILLAPSSPLLWAIPLAVVLAGAGGMAAWLAARRPTEAAVAHLTPEQRHGLHEEVEALDA